MKSELCSKCNKNPRHSTTTYCRECRKEYNQKNKKHIKDYNKNRYEENKEVILGKIKQYHIENKEDIKEYTQQWYQDNKEHTNEYNRNKYKNNLVFKLKITLRNTLNKKLKEQNSEKTKSSLILIGCTIEELRLHLESQFLPEMNWANHGKIWEIDHIKACSLFNLTIIEEQQKCFHYTNLMPRFSTTEIAESFGYKNHVGNRNKGNRPLL